VQLILLQRRGTYHNKNLIDSVHTICTPRLIQRCRSFRARSGVFRSHSSSKPIINEKCSTRLSHASIKARCSTLNHDSLQRLRTPTQQQQQSAANAGSWTSPLGAPRPKSLPAWQNRNCPQKMLQHAWRTGLRTTGSVRSWAGAFSFFGGVGGSPFEPSKCMYTAPHVDHTPSPLCLQRNARPTDAHRQAPSAPLLRARAGRALARCDHQAHARPQAVLCERQAQSQQQQQQQRLRRGCARCGGRQLQKPRAQCPQLQL